MRTYLDLQNLTVFLKNISLSSVYWIQLKKYYHILNNKWFSNLQLKLSTNFVYTFKCNCCNAIYYGKTKCYFYVKAAKQIGTSQMTKKKKRKKKHVKNVKHFRHLLTCACDIIFDDVTILSKDCSNLLIKESLLIARDNLSR